LGGRWAKQDSGGKRQKKTKFPVPGELRKSPGPQGKGRTSRCIGNEGAGKVGGSKTAQK